MGTNSRNNRPQPRLFERRSQADRAARRLLSRYPLVHSTLFSHGLWAVKCDRENYLLNDGSVGELSLDEPSGEAMRSRDGR